MIRKFLLAFAALVASPVSAHSVLFEGDSITAPATLHHAELYAAAHPTITVTNTAVSGSAVKWDANPTYSVYARLPTSITTKPDVVTILIGANDLAGGAYASAADWITDLWITTDYLRARGIKVAVGTVLPKCGATTHNSYRATANASIRAAVGTHIDAVIDYAANSTIGDDADACDTSYYNGDGIHPEGNGHAVMNTIEDPVLTALLATVPNYSGEPAAIASNFTVSDDIQSTSSTTFASDGETKYRFSCNDSHSNYDDMLLFPALPGGNPHSHRYYGNTSTNGNSTYSTLRQNGNGTCWANRINRSAYWVPDLYVDSTHIKKSDYIIVYYEVDPTNVSGANAAYNNFKRLPRGTKMITGYKPGDPSYYTSPPGVTLSAGYAYTGFNGFAGWTCLSSGVTTTTLAALSCPAGSQISAWLTFPQCWDGVNQSSATYRSHIVHPVNDTNLGITRCPASHPYRTFEIVIKIAYPINVTDEHQGWWLSSDRQDANPANWVANGTSMHGDYVEAWDDAYRETLQVHCIGIPIAPNAADPHSCNSAQFGNGDQGVTSNVTTPSYTLAAVNVIAAPAVTITNLTSGTRLRARFRRR